MLPKLEGFVDSIDDVPSTWIFAYYFKLDPNNFDGSRVQILSPLNPEDTNPSMSLFYASEWKEYRFKCFSTGKGGSAVHLMQHVWGKSFSETAAQIESDYQKFLNEGKTLEFAEIKGSDNYTLTDFKVRELWNQNDVEYWTQFEIGSEMLRWYNVWPLESYTMTRSISKEEFTVTGQFIYGYFDQNGKLDKVYQPKKKKMKFIKIPDNDSLFQGIYQAQAYPSDKLVITSSLKDVMTLAGLGLKVNFVAPDSESSLLNPDQLKFILGRYDSVAVYFDSDQAGRNAMEKYQDLYGFPSVYLPKAKDPSDVVKLFDQKTLLYELVPKLERSFNKYNHNEVELKVGKFLKEHFNKSSLAA